MAAKVRHYDYLESQIEILKERRDQQMNLARGSLDEKMIQRYESKAAQISSVLTWLPLALEIPIKSVRFGAGSMKSGKSWNSARLSLEPQYLSLLSSEFDVDTNAIVFSKAVYETNNPIAIARIRHSMARNNEPLIEEIDDGLVPAFGKKFGEFQGWVPVAFRDANAARGDLRPA